MESFKYKYHDAEEQTPPNYLKPDPRGLSVSNTEYFDTSHAANNITRCSNTVFIIFMNKSPITWYSKTQNNAE